jgi:hypothetical protein
MRWGMVHVVFMVLTKMERKWFLSVVKVATLATLEGVFGEEGEAVETTSLFLVYVHVLEDVHVIVDDVGVGRLRQKCRYRIMTFRALNSNRRTLSFVKEGTNQLAHCSSLLLR